MTREEWFLRGADLSTMKGMEIGALDKPIIPRDSPHVFYVDFIDTAGLRDRYKQDPAVVTERIVDVSGVWGQNTLEEVAGASAPFDVVVASHVIEHVPDLVTWLGELSSVLKDGGSIRLAIPDRRYTFDFLRKETELACVLNAFVVNARVPQPRQVLDFALNMAMVDCVAAWTGSVDTSSLVRCYTPDQALELARSAISGVYHDVHCWVFTPKSFVVLMQELSRMGLIDLEFDHLVGTREYTIEFFVELKKNRDPEQVRLSWENAGQKPS